MYCNPYKYIAHYIIQYVFLNFAQIGNIFF